jgi:hypothetical protein
MEKRRLTAGFLSEDDIEATTGEQLRTQFDVLYYPGHTEYVTEREYDVVQRYRDLGGRLVFLSSNNFFWRVDRKGEAIKRIKLWRELKRPEASLLGVQYRANDDGTKQGVYYVTNAEAATWLFARTGLVDGATFGTAVGGFGIEIDQTTKDSPPGTQIVAIVPNLFGIGVHAEMTYYETEAGARVFSAGTLDFSTSVLQQPMATMLENLWYHMLEPPAVPGETPS